MLSPPKDEKEINISSNPSLFLPQRFTFGLNETYSIVD